MKVGLIFLFLLAATGVFGQTKTEQFIDRLAGKWAAIDSVGHTLEIKRSAGSVLLVTETAIDDTGKAYVVESLIYLDGRRQTDGLKQSATEARTAVGDSNLTTTYYGVKNGGVKQLFKERLPLKNGSLIRSAQIKIGVPFLAAGTKQTFRKITN